MMKVTGIEYPVIYRRRMFFAMKSTLAGRSASRRMK
jgi:hypothetical protein